MIFPVLFNEHWGLGVKNISYVYVRPRIALLERDAACTLGFSRTRPRPPLHSFPS